MPRERCATCRNFDRGERKPGPDEDDTGLCRFPAPAIQTVPQARPWPYCKTTDWCSHWAAKDP